jgi:hypothetical protein
VVAPDEAGADAAAEEAGAEVAGDDADEDALELQAAALMARPAARPTVASRRIFIWFLLLVTGAVR